MGHLGAKNVWTRLEGKIDGLWMRAPKRETFREAPVLLYTPEEAERVISMPCGFCPLDRVARACGM
ncbi:MAG: 4Fe-4S ferredoxin, partial [Deltaproteobacteria bacterium]|nr:4Fe-4S ferredoxin [Deltaproteobacteria bacterium]